MIKLGKYLVVVIGIACIGLVKISGQEVLDTIYKIEGKILPVDVVNMTQSYVSFTVPGSTETFTMERKDIQKIVYKTGRVDEFNKPVFEMIDDYSWEAVWLTEDMAEVHELYKRGVISAQSPASSRSSKAAKKSAIIRLQKKASAMQGNVVYVTKKVTIGGYGEYPGYYIEGIVYGLEPLKEGEDVKSDKDKALSGGVVM